MSWGLTTFEAGRSLAMVSRSTLALVHTDHRRTIDLLWRMVANDAPFDDIVEELAREGVNGLPDFGLVRLEPEGTRVVARGSIAIVIDVAGGDPRRIDASDLRTWSEAFVADAVGVALDDVSEVGPDAPLACCVLAGVVPARALRRDLRADDPRADWVGDAWAPPAVMPAVVMEPRGTDADPDYDYMYGRTVMRTVEHAAVRLPDPVPGPVDESDASGVTAVEPSRDHDGLTISRGDLPERSSDEMVPTPPPTPGGPFVAAITCPDGHPNPPGASRCRSCGAPPTRSNPIQIPRPVLGVLVFSTGERVPIDRPMIIGRLPKVVGTAEWELPRLVKIESPGRGLSRSHLEVRLDGWRVLVQDMNSANGTEVTMPGEPPREVLPGESVHVVDGTRVDLGGEVHFTVEGLA